MSAIYYLPLVTRREFLNEVRPHDPYFQKFVLEIGTTNLKMRGELQGGPNERGTLYILGHGSFQNTLTMKTTGSLPSRSITPAGLGAHLLGCTHADCSGDLDMGHPILSRGITAIKVFACFSAVSPAQGAHSFTYGFASYLRSRGVKIPIYGYTGATGFDKRKRRILRPKGSERASSNRVKFGSTPLRDKYSLTEDSQDSLEVSGYDFWVLKSDAIEPWSRV